ncbi:MAG TPA: alkanesulfonate monooxygenase [Verrucomicrobiales bacterium]|nr:alkanesulfonate monooxygenase [Pedosphaera sp.]HCB98724.1 alkanesulfonate monooxygenase [Verrucomicrobiales bacterium]
MISLRTPTMAAELGWFSALCSDDYEYLGFPEDHLRSSYSHCKAITQRADTLGFQNILLPSSYQIGQDTLAFAAAMSEQTEQIQLLSAIRCGEMHPPMLARAISTLDHMLEGRLALNIISSDLPGCRMASEDRYHRSTEVIQILQQAWTQPCIDFKGDFFNFQLDTQPVKTYQQNGGPLLYFGGYSSSARDLCARFCDVYLLWPDTQVGLKASMEDVAHRAAAQGRSIDFGLRIHVIVRETEQKAREAAIKLVSKLEDSTGHKIKARAQDHLSKGVMQQNDLREKADKEGYAEAHLWTGIGRARSGCGAAIVGNPDQVINTLKNYMRMGFRSFILSGYPHLEACELFAKYVLPAIPTTRLAVEQKRVPQITPETPLTHAKRI